MSHRVFAAALLGSLLCAASQQALAGDPPLPAPALPRPIEAEAAPAWPTELKHRNARYASLTRVDDPKGDVHERLIAHMQMNRVIDRVGDLEEVRRRRTSGAVPPLAVKDALVLRDRDVDGDGNEVVLASMRHERRHAETRRFRDLAGDSAELAAYKVERRQIRFDREDRVLLSGEGQPASRNDFLDRRDDQADRESGETMGESERAEARDDDQADRALAREDELAGHGRFGEDGEDVLDDEDGPGMDDPLETIGEDSDVRMEESELERETEAQLEQDEAGAGGTP